jgi:hypothetical protein
MPRGSKCYMWWHGAQCRGIDSCPGESCLRRASWWILCRSRGGFEGSCNGALAWSSSVRRFEGSTDGRSEAAQRRAWRCPVDMGPHSDGVMLQCPGWRHSGGDGRTGPEVTGETRLTGLASRHRPRRVQSRWPYLFQGCRHTLSRGAAWRRYESGRHNVME